MAFLGRRRGCSDLFGMAGAARDFVGGAATALSLQRLRIHAVAEVSWPRYGLWRSLVSALVWGTRGRRFKSSQPDSDVVRHQRWRTTQSLLQVRSQLPLYECVMCDFA